MKVSKQSWHYRWMKWVGFEIPGNLCKYFWTFVWSVLIFPVVVVVGVFATVLVTLPLWAMFTDSIDAQILAIIIGLAEMVVLSAILNERIKDRKRAEKFTKYGPYYSDWPVKRPSIVKAWVKAKKDKVCPLIEVVE